MTKKKILVTAAAGNVGSEIAKELKKNNIPFKAADIRDVKDILGQNTEYVYFDLKNPETYEEAYQDVNKMFLNRPPQMTEFKDSIFPAIDACKTAGIEHIVFLSMIGVNKRVPHYKIEKYIINSGINYTFLRASFFMQNLITAHGDALKKENDILIPAGKGKISFIDIRDIAAVAGKIFTDSSGSFINKVLNLTGCEALDFSEVAEIMTRELGKTITYSNPKPKIFQNKMLTYGFSKEFVKVMKMIYFIVRLGRADELYDDTEQILGRNPIKMAQFIRDYSDSWK